MKSSPAQLVILADPPEALELVCGISLLERLLRTLQRLGFRQAIILSHAREQVAAHLATPSWARGDLEVEHRDRVSGELTPREVLEHTNSTERLLLCSAGFYYDGRLLQTLASAGSTNLLVDSAPPRSQRALLGKSRTSEVGLVLCASMVERAWLTSAEPDRPLFEQLARASEQGAIKLADVARQPAYVRDMRRTIRPLWFPRPAPEDRQLAERLVLDTAQNGTLDFPALVHAPIETWIISHLCRTRITPTQITFFTAVIALLVTVLFARGQLVAGTLLALAVGVLDGLDGKQARVKVETTRRGEYEHVLDYVLELLWWSALAYRFNAYGPFILLVLSDLCDRLVKEIVKRRTNCHLDDLSRFDRVVRLVGGRRNIYIWIFAASLLAGIPHQGFVALCLWGAFTAAVHVLRAFWIPRR